MRCIMLFYNDLSDSPAGVMSSLFGIVNLICPFCILLCIYTFYYVLPLHNIRYCILLLTWRFRLCGVFFFLFGSVKFCILLCNSTFFYALKHVIIQDWVTFGIFYSVLRSRIMFHFVKLYYAYVISCMALSEKKLDGRAGEWVLFSATLPFPAIRCQKWQTMSPVMLQPETIFAMCCSIFWDS